MLYKVYWSDGAQVPYPKDEEIIVEVNNVEDFNNIKIADRKEAEKAGLFNVIGKEIDDEYIASIKEQSLNSEVISKVADDFKIVYTPLHGSGNKPVKRILEEVGFKNIYIVPEQEEPDPNFSTVQLPNPEDPKAFELALKLADKVDADIVVGTDPDADRVGAVVKNSKGEYVVLTGNMTGALLTEYILSQRKSSNTLPENSAVVSTIVSTNMTSVIAKKYNVDFLEVLTGFKYIGEKIKEFEKTGEKQYVFGFEESYGCLAGTFARDKDAIGATMLICEMAAYYKTKGMTLYEGLQELYKEYGYYRETIKSITLEGKDGIEKMRSMMNNLRENPPKKVGNLNVSIISDYKSGVTKNTATNEEYSTNLPKSDVLYYILEDESWFCIRPSGTEPKIKVYFGISSETSESAETKLAKLVEDAMSVVSNA